MKRLFWNLLALLGFWIPTKYYLPTSPDWDWVLISFVDCKGKGIRAIPEVAELGLSGWHTCDDDKTHQYFLNNDCVVTHWRKIPVEPVRRRELRKMYIHSIKCFFHRTFTQETPTVVEKKYL